MKLLFVTLFVLNVMCAYWNFVINTGTLSIALGALNSIAGIYVLTMVFD